jgi:dTDP-4-amino-4,6-dideoxygalactose transaminase
LSTLKKIPYVDLTLQHRAIKAELLRAVEDVFDHGQFILGPEVEQFEARFAALTGTRHAVGVGSGTDALILGLRSLGIGPGDEVITVSNSFVASASCIALVGAKPVFVDVGPDYNLDPEKLAGVLTPRSRAILPVHLTGRAADMTAIIDFARENDLLVIEDAAQAVFAEHRGKRVGSLGDIGCFSLHPLKTLSACGDGGVITTNDDAVYEQLRLLRNIGLEERDKTVVWSGNSRLDTMQAAMLLVKLKYAEGWTEMRSANAGSYVAALSDIPEITLAAEDDRDRSVYHTFVVQAQRRDQLREYLQAREIGTAVHYPTPIHLQPVGLSLGYEPGDFPETESQAEKIVSLPVYPELSEVDIDYVATTIREFYGK